MPRSSSIVPLIIALALFLSIAIAFASLLAIVSADQPPSTHSADADTTSDSTSTSAHQSSGEEQQTTAQSLPDDAALLSMKVRQLKALLAKKGPDAECVACTSKQEFVDRIRETADWPDVKQTDDDERNGTDDPKLEELAALFNKNKDPEEVEKIKKNLEAAGIDASNIFSTGGDFNADAFAKQFASWKSKRDPQAGADVPPSAKDEAHVEL